MGREDDDTPIFSGVVALAAVRDKGGIVIEQSSCFSKGLWGLFFLSLFLSLITGCHYRENPGIPATEEKVVFNRVAVAPFRQIVPEESAKGAVLCPICGAIFSATGGAGAPEKVLESLFLEQLEKRKPTFSFISGEWVAGISRRVEANSLKSSVRQVLQEVGSELGAEGIVAGYLFRFRERQGVAYSVEQPASIAFEIHLLRVSDGALVWRGRFDKTQSSLMEDIFQIPAFFREKGRWVTAAELAEEGMEQVLKTFPGQP